MPNNPEILRRYNPKPDMSDGPEMPLFNDPKFDTELHSENPDIRRHCLELKNVTRRAMGNPLYPGFIMSPRFQIDPVHRPPGARFPPAFALSGGAYQLRLQRAIQPFRGDRQWSQVWLAEAFDPETKTDHGPVIVKIFQQSFFLNPMDPDGVINVSRTMSALRLAATESHMYQHMTQIQGLHVPYCFGMYQFPMPHGEIVQAILFEFIEGESLARKHQIQSRLSEDEWRKSVDDAKLLTKSALKAVNTLHHVCRVVHRTSRPQDHLILREEGQPPQVIIIDFAGSMAEVSDDLLEGRFHWHRIEVSTLLESICTCCTDHYDAVKDWAAEEGLEDFPIEE